MKPNKGLKRIKYIAVTNTAFIKSNFLRSTVEYTAMISDNKKVEGS